MNKTEIIIDGQNKGAITAINGVETKLNSLTGNINGPLAGAMGNFAKFIPTAAIATGVYAIGSFVKGTIDAADEISKMSQKIGISTESLSTLKYAADLSDLSLDQMQGSLKKLSVNLYDISKGNGKDVALTFNELGISAIDANGKVRQTDDVLLDLADSFSRMSDGTEKTALAVKLFGKSGLDMIPFLNQGKDGIIELTNEAEKLGLKISTETGLAAEEFNDSITTMNAELTGLANEVLPALLPKLNKFQRGIRDLSDAVYNFSGETLAQGLMRAASNGFTLGINLEQVLGIEKLITEEYKRREQLNENYGAHLQGIVDQHKALYEQLNGVNKQEDKHLSTVRAIREEYAKIVATIAAGKPEKNPHEAKGQFPSFSELDNKGFEMVPVDVNPFDPLKNNTQDFVSFWQENSDTIRGITDSTFGNMAQTMEIFYQQDGKNAKTYFAMYKAFATAQAIVSGVDAVIGAYARGNELGGPILGGVYAAIAGAFSLAQISKINSATMGSSSGGGVSGSGGGSIPSYSGGGQTNNNSNNQNAVFNITITGEYRDADTIARDLIPALKKAYGDTLGGGN